MWRPADGKKDDDAGDQDGGLTLGLEIHLSDAAAQAAIADHKYGERKYVTHKCLQQHTDQLLGLRNVFPVETVLLPSLRPHSLRGNDRYAEQKSYSPQSQEDFMQCFFPLPDSWGEGVADSQEALHAHKGDEEDAAVHTGVDHVHHRFAGGLSKHPGVSHGVDPHR